MSLLARNVGDLVAERPERAAVFERHHIDYCCNGDRSLEQACADKGLSAEAVVAELAETPARGDAVDWRAAPVPELVSHILETHHIYLRSAFPSIREKLSRALEAHGREARPLAELSDVVQRLEAELHQHMAKEEMVLFPLALMMHEARESGSPPPPPLRAAPSATRFT